MRKQKGQHFLLKASSRTLSLKDMYRMTEDQAFEIFKSLRWKDGKPVCPECGCNEHYFLKNYKRFECRSCKKHYTVTSGTIFAYHKLELRDYLCAIALLSNCAKNKSSLELSRDLNVQYKTAFVLSHKIREAILNHKETGLQGEIEIDGSYLGGYIKPENEKKDRIDRRLWEYQNDKKRCIITVRQRGKNGAVKTLTFIRKDENQTDINEISKKAISKGSTIYADESPAYDLLHAKYEVKRINHSVKYADVKSRINTNQAESYFARLKRAYKGQHHKMSPEYLHLYAFEIAFREDYRRVDNGNIFNELVYRSMHSPISTKMCGYWQRKR